MGIFNIAKHLSMHNLLLPSQIDFCPSQSADTTSTDGYEHVTKLVDVGSLVHAY